MNFIKVENPEKYTNFLLENDAPFTQAFFYGDWHKKNGANVYTYIVEEEEKALAYIQFIEGKANFNQTFLYAPYGPVIDKGNTAKVLPFLKKELKKVTKELNAIFFRLDFSSEIEREVGPLFEKAPRFTNKGAIFQPRAEWILDISGPKEEIYNNFHKKTRYCIREAEKKEVEIKIITENLMEYFEDFYNTMKITSERNNFNLHKKEYYENVFQSLEENKIGFIAQALIDSEPSSYSLILNFGKTSVYLYGASKDTERKVSTSHLAQWEIIQRLKDLGVQYYNFGGISTPEFPDKDLVALTRFKERFGGKVSQHSNFYDIQNKKIFYKLFLFKKYLGTIKK